MPYRKKSDYIEHLLDVYGSMSDHDKAELFMEDLRVRLDAATRAELKTEWIDLVGEDIVSP